MADEPVRSKSQKDQIIPIQPQSAAIANNDDVIIVEERQKIAPELVDKLWLVSDGEGRSGKVKAKAASSAKYAFMRARGIVDTKQEWSVTLIGDAA